MLGLTYCRNTPPILQNEAGELDSDAAIVKQPLIIEKAIYLFKTIIIIVDSSCRTIENSKQLVYEFIFL